MMGIGVVGELALDGAIRPVHGVLPMSIAASKNGMKTFIVPAENALEVAVVEGVEVLAA